MEGQQEREGEVGPDGRSGRLHIQYTGWREGGKEAGTNKLGWVNIAAILG